MIFQASQNSSLTKRLVFSYGKDWLLVIAMIIVFFAIDIIAPFHREFSITDTSLMHTFATKETVPVWLLIVSHSKLAC
jgi:diacylglycerol diphosphate phosphatase/phosphatidate phosphatase